MQKTIQNLIAKIYTSGNFMLSGALMFGVFQVPFTLPPSTLPKEQAVKTVSIEENITPLKEAFFGKSDNVSDEIVAKQVAYVSSRNAFPASLAVIKKHANTIKAIAREKGVPEDVALGVSLLENGGSETAVSSAGALGVFQLMPGTARSLGLTVNKKVDERKDPYTNIEAGIRYLKGNYERFGDWGLATWAYHAGEGNVSKAVKLYAKENHNINLAGVKDPSAMKSYIEKNGITIHKLLSSKAVQTLTKKLNDDSAGYPYKVLATATLFKQAQNQTSVVPGQILGNK